MEWFWTERLSNRYGEEEVCWDVNPRPKKITSKCISVRLE